MTALDTGKSGTTATLPPGSAATATPEATHEAATAADTNTSSGTANQSSTSIEDTRRALAGHRYDPFDGPDVVTGGGYSGPVRTNEPNGYTPHNPNYYASLGFSGDFTFAPAATYSASRLPDKVDFEADNAILSRFDADPKFVDWYKTNGQTIRNASKATGVDPDLITATCYRAMQDKIFPKTAGQQKAFIEDLAKAIQSQYAQGHNQGGALENLKTSRLFHGASATFDQDILRIWEAMSSARHDRKATPATGTDPDTATKDAAAVEAEAKKKEHDGGIVHRAAKGMREHGMGWAVDGVKKGLDLIGK